MTKRDYGNTSKLETCQLKAVSTFRLGSVLSGQDAIRDIGSTDKNGTLKYTIHIPSMLSLMKPITTLCYLRKYPYY